MAHHKRRRPKHQRAGCLFCKPAKDEREAKRARPADARRLDAAAERIRDRDRDVEDDLFDARWPLEW